MKNKKAYLSIFIIFFIAISVGTNFFSNSWILLTDSSNYIPSESNIFFFQPIQVDDGSGGYWRYGEDLKQYYYFSLDDNNVYYSIKKDNICPNFMKTNIETWCEKIKFINQSN